jgi:DNA gyrase subunit B
MSLERLARQGLLSAFVELLIKEGVENRRFLEDKFKMLQLKETLIDSGYDAGEVNWNEDRKAYNLDVRFTDRRRQGGFSVDEGPKILKKITIDRGLIYSKGYQDLIVLGKKILKYDTPPFAVKSKDQESEDKAQVINDKQGVLNFLIEKGKKGLAVQRYKGLGEMNPEQLWETTMNPEKRNMLQVKVEDMHDTDEIFTILMGEEVEPRREFIQTNALEVSILDI